MVIPLYRYVSSDVDISTNTYIKPALHLVKLLETTPYMSQETKSLINFTCVSPGHQLK